MKPGVGHTIFRRIPGRPTMLAMAIAAAMAASLQAPAWGAGLGQLTVQSALGQPLVAEVEITSLSRDELDSLSAKLAPAEAFRQAGLEFRPALSTLRFAIERRSDGRAFVRITSTQPVNEPFVDLLVELNWAAGRFVREYTFLLDPPELRIGRNTVDGNAAGSRGAASVARGGITPVAASIASTGGAAAGRPGTPGAPTGARSNSTAVGSGANGGRPAGGDAAGASNAANVGGNRGAAPGSAGATDATAPTQGADQSAPQSTPRSVTVRRGEGLASIAARAAPDGIAVEQAILAIYNANPQAFFGNVHQMYAGRTLAIPDRAMMQSVDAAEARHQIQEQTAAFNTRRERLAAAAPTVDTAIAGSADPGSVAPTAELPASAAATGDQLRLSRAAPAVGVPGATAGGAGSAGNASGSAGPAAAELGSAGAGAGAAGAGSSAAQAAAETRIAGAAALREQAARVASLEKNVADLQGLLQLKSRQLAELQQQVDASDRSPRAAAGLAGSAAGTPATASDDAASPSASAALAAGAAAPSASPAAGARGSPVARPTPAPSVLAAGRERSFVDDLLASPMTVPGLAAILVALGAYGWYTLRRRKSENFEDSLIAADAFTANSLFGTTGGQAVDTSDEAMFGASVRNTSADVHATEVDPIAEAEVYIAYGRESQAEEILREALERQPERQAIRLKLLEMYAGRKDAAAFGRLAQEMYDMSGGHNEEWPKAAMLGLAVDPDNALYAGGSMAIADLDTSGANSLSGFATAGSEMEPFDTSAPIAERARDRQSLDDDIGRTGRVAAHPSWYHVDLLPRDFADTQPMHDERVSREPPALDFSLGIDAPSERAATPAAEEFALADDRSELERAADGRFELPSLDFGRANAGEARTGDSPSTPDAGRLSPELARAERQYAGRAADEGADSERSSVFPEFGDFRIDLPALEDLGLKSARHGAMFETEGEALALAGLDIVPAEDNTMQWQEMATKLDLASAYEEIGDKDGARELLEEVVRAGDTGQKHTAGAMLSKIT